MSSPDDRIHTDGLPGLQCRREIHDLITDNVQFSLYIQALSMSLLHTSQSVLVDAEGTLV